MSHLVLPDWFILIIYHKEQTFNLRNISLCAYCISVMLRFSQIQSFSSTPCSQAALKLLYAAFDNIRLQTCHFEYRDHMERLQTGTSIFYRAKGKVFRFGVTNKSQAQLHTDDTRSQKRGLYLTRKEWNSVSTGSSKGTDFILFSVTLETLARNADRK